MNIGSPPAGNSAASYVVDVGNAQEVAFSSAAALGEFETAGLVMNIVPKAGGNTTRGSFFASGTGGRLQANNITRALMDQGVVDGPPLTDVYDVSGTIGGPIARDRVWYFVNAHSGGSTKASANVFYNLNAADPSKWLYAPDASRREYSDRTFEDASARVTWQASPRQKVGVFWDAQALCRRCTGCHARQLRAVARVAGGSRGPRPEAERRPGDMVVAGHESAAPRGGLQRHVLRRGEFRAPTESDPQFHSRARAVRARLPGQRRHPRLVYRSQDFSVAHAGSYLWTGSVSRVTGTHSIKAGYQYTAMIDDRTWLTNAQNLTYRFNNGVPNQLTQSISPWVNDARAASSGLFVQDSWTRERVTLQGALRFDRARSWFPAQQEGPSRFLPDPIVFPETVGIDSYKDITLRAGATYDLFGSGTTALKLTLGRYLEGAGITGNYANTNPTLRLPQTTMVFGTAGVTRSWIDANGNVVPDCDLLNAGAQDLRGSGGDLCGVLSNASFGTSGLTNRFDPGILSGWGVRPSDWNLGVSIEHELARGAAVAVAYRRRWFHGFSVVDNLALQPSDLTPFSIVAPVDARLPGGGGYTLADLYDVIPEKSGRVDNLVTDSSQYGAWSQYFNGIDATLNIRRDRFTFIGGTSTGQAVRRQLRCPRASARACHHDDGDERVRAGPDRLRGRAGEPLLSRRVRRAHTAERSLHVPRPESGRATRRDLPEQAGDDAGGQLRGAERAGGGDARQESLGRRGQRDGEPAGAGHEARQSDQRGRHPHREAPEIRTVACDAGDRPLQRAELERGADLQLGIRSGPDVAATVDDPDAALSSPHRRDRVLTAMLTSRRRRWVVGALLIAAAAGALASVAKCAVRRSPEEGARSVLAAGRTLRSPSSAIACWSRSSEWVFRPASTITRKPSTSQVRQRGYQTAFRDSLRLKYDQHRFDLVIPVGDIPVDFVEKNRDDLFPNALSSFFANRPPGRRLPNSTGLIVPLNLTARSTWRRRFIRISSTSSSFRVPAPRSRKSRARNFVRWSPGSRSRFCQGSDERS
jgi:hypothetical protein